MLNPPRWFIHLITKRFYRLYQKNLHIIDPPFDIIFTKVPSGWIEKPCWGDLTWAWRRNGIPATGIAGFFCGGADSNGCSTLWNPDSPNYLAWCGTYIYKPDNFNDFYDPKIGATEIARNIGYKDDITWSKMFGNRNPYYEEIVIQRLENPLISVPYTSESYFSTVRCQAYLGTKSLSLTACLASASMAELYKKTSGIVLGYSFLRPTYELCKGHSYENVLRDVWVTRVLFPERGLIYVLYATGVKAEDSSWDYSKVLEPEFHRFFKGVKLIEVRKEK